MSGLVRSIALILLVPAFLLSACSSKDKSEAGPSSASAELSATCSEYIKCCEQASAKKPEIAEACKAEEKKVRDGAAAGTDMEPLCKTNLEANRGAKNCD